MSKTRMGKRVASLLLSLVMMLSLLPTTVYAEGADDAATNDAVVEETIAPVNAEGVDAVDLQEAESSGDEVSGEDGTVKKDETSTAVAKIGDKQYETLDDAIKAVQNGEIIEVNAGEYKLNGSLTYTDKAFTIEGAGVSFDMSAAVALHGAKITFNNVTFDYKTNGNYIGLQHADTLVYNNCTINGMVFLYAVNETFNNCTFNQTSADAYNVWTYGAQNVAFNGCTFNCAGKAVLVYNEGAIAKTDLTVTDTKFIASAPVEGKAAIEIDTSLMKDGTTITIDAATEAEDFAEGSNSKNSLWNDKVNETVADNKDITVIVNNETVYAPKATASAVAKVDNTEYATLQAAIDAAKTGDIVTLLADTRENVTIDKALTLDLNGHTLNGSTGERKPALTITARVTVMDSSEAKTGTIMREDTAKNSGVSSHYVIDVQGDGWLTFESGNVKNGSGVVGVKGASLVRVGDDSVKKYPGLVINGGTFTQDNFIAIKVDCGYLKLNGGKVNSANSYAVENWFNANINGGTVNGAVAAWTYSDGTNSFLTINGGTVTGDVTSVNYGNAEGKTATVTITGGAITGELDTRSYDPKTNELTNIDDAAKATIEVTGGTFNNDPTKYVAENSAITKNSDGTFGVAKTYLAKVGETSYYTMDEAFHAAVASGETLYLLRDYTTGAEQNSGSKSFAIDLDGHTWTYTGTNTNCAAFQINYSDVTLTVKNGTVVSNSMVGLIPSAIGMDGPIAYDNAGLVFEGVTMTANGHSGIETNGSNANDTVTLKNSTLDVPNGFGIYFPSSGTLTIDNSKINAKTMGVQVCAGSLNVTGDKTAVTVTGDAVPKTENDGAIQDGAAISIVNRPGYKGLGDVTVTGGTFKANGTNEAIKAYKWENQTASAFDNSANVVAVSGGTFSSIPDRMAALCKVGYRAVEDKDNNVYIVKEGKYVIEVTSRIQDTNQTVATPTGGGQADYGEEVTVTTYAVTGFTFLGWYDSEGNQLSTKDDMTYTHKVTGDCTLIAKYAQDSTRMFRLTVNGTVFTVNERTEYAHHYSELASGSRVAIVYTGTDNFLYWVNASKNVVTTNKTLEYTMVNDAEFTAVTAPATSDSAIVVFKNNIERGQELQARRYYSNETIVFPATPSSYGKTFAYWAILDTNGNILKDQAGNAVVATESAIKAKIAEGTGYIVVAAVYTANGYYKATAHFVDSNGNTVANDMVNANVPTGSGWQVTAPDVKNKFFSHWKDADDNVLSTNQTYAIYAMDTVEVTAVYVDTENDKHATMNTVKLTALTRVVGNSHDLGLVAQYDVASGKTINRVGILFTTNANYKDSLTLENKKALTSTPLDNPKNNSNVYRHWLNGINNLSTVVYARAYVTTTDGETIYSEVIEGSFNSWNGN